MTNKLTDQKKRDEWRQWGKDAYKSAASMMRGNSHHPDYDTLAKREAVHDRYNDSYLLSPERAAILKEKWGYNEDDIVCATLNYKEGYDASRKWYKREDAKYQAILDSYAPLFKKAEELAATVDVSDIKDGFPCGYAHLYLDYALRETPLGKALAHFNNGSQTAYKYELHLKFPTHGQCINFSERICSKVQDFLRQQNVLVNTYSWID